MSLVYAGVLGSKEAAAISESEVAVCPLLSFVCGEGAVGKK